MGAPSSVSVSESKSEGNTLDANNEEPMTSNELLSRMRIRNRLLEPVATPGPEPGEEETHGDDAASNIPAASSVSVQEEHVELLTDIRNFVAFGATVDGRASTQEILARFSERLPPGSSPLFRFMLSEVCEFHRMPSGEGVWRLRSEFRW
jgi:DNA excision repair protein ERCC-6